MTRPGPTTAASLSSLPRPLSRLTSTVSSPMQGLAVSMALSSWVALVMKMTMSILPMPSAL